MDSATLDEPSSRAVQTTSLDSAAAMVRKSDIPSKDEVTELRLQEENGHYTT